MKFDPILLGNYLFKHKAIDKEAYQFLFRSQEIPAYAVKAAMLEGGLIDEHEFLEATVNVYGLSLLEKVPAGLKASSIEKIISRDVILRHLALPVGFTDDGEKRRLRIAVENPFDDQALTALAAQHELRLVLMAREELVDALASIFPSAEALLRPSEEAEEAREALSGLISVLLDSNIITHREYLSNIKDFRRETTDERNLNNSGNGSSVSTT